MYAWSQQDICEQSLSLKSVVALASELLAWTSNGFSTVVAHEHIYGFLRCGIMLMYRQ